MSNYRKCFKAAIDTYKYLDSLINLGVLEEQLGHLDEAETCYKAASRHEALAVLYVAKLLTRVGKDAEAEEWWFKVFEFYKATREKSNKPSRRLLEPHLIKSLKNDVTN